MAAQFKVEPLPKLLHLSDADCMFDQTVCPFSECTDCQGKYTKKCHAVTPNLSKLKSMFDACEKDRIKLR